MLLHHAVGWGRERQLLVSSSQSPVHQKLQQFGLILVRILSYTMNFESVELYNDVVILFTKVNFYFSFVTILQFKTYNIYIKREHSILLYCTLL